MPAEGPVRHGQATGFHLIETMRWQPGAGLLRRSLHLARLDASARTLGFAIGMARVEGALEMLERCTEPMRVRLTLDRAGSVAVESQPFTPLPGETIWRLALAQTRLSSADPLLRHKTSLRQAYAEARAEFSADQADEVLLLNERGELCEGTITSVFVETGHGLLATPPLGSGVLAGVLRAQLLAAGRAEERVLFPRDIADASRVFVGNSLRGLIEARFSAT